MNRFMKGLPLFRIGNWYWRVFCLVAVLLCAAAVNAQEYRGTIQGTVTDSTHASVPGAKVTLRNTNTGIEAIQQTDATGHYLFQAVLPGNYSVTFEAAGFQKFIAENILMQARGDDTVDAMLTIGAITQSVTVSGQVQLVQFNTSTMNLTIEGQAVQDIPVLGRNPLNLNMMDAMMVPAHVYANGVTPTNTTGDAGYNMGADDSNQHNLTMDGASLQSGGFNAYIPTMDMVQSVSVEPNSVDAEQGFGSGGAMNIATKSGTNHFHGTLEYLGRNTATNALANRVSRSKNPIKQNIWGASLGTPIKKNKLFNFFGYEQWLSTTPADELTTAPTAAQRQGNFSQTLTPQGALRVIYDPFTTVYDPATSTVTRTPFLNNVIPPNRIDRAGQIIVNDMYLPNNPGTDLSGVNNSRLTYSVVTHYWNYSDRVDYNPNEKWRITGRISHFYNRGESQQWGGIATPVSAREFPTWNVMGDAVWIASPRTTVDFRYSYATMKSIYHSTNAAVPDSLWANLWPNNWYQSEWAPLKAMGMLTYYPRLIFNSGSSNGAAAGMRSFYVFDQRSPFDPSVNITHERGINHMKFGVQLRYGVAIGGNTGPGQFVFQGQDTGNTFLSNYNITQSGDQYASALLGVVNSGYANIAPVEDTHFQQWGLYFQDDLRLTRNITLNLGMRWEREPAPAEVNRQLVQSMNLNSPIPELQNTVMPSQVTAIATVPYKFNGAMIYTSDAYPRLYNATWGNFEPKVGIAYRINDITAFRAGYSRNEIPFNLWYPNAFYLPTYGYSQQTQVLSPVAGVPQTKLSDPFPNATNPVVMPKGAAAGPYNQLGNSIEWFQPPIASAMVDRLNFGIQRMVPQKIFVDATFYMAFTHNMQGSAFNLNQMDPSIAYAHPGLTAQAVANPFYGLPSNIMPGSLAKQKTVAASQLLSAYPQYGALYADLYAPNGKRGKSDHYYSLQLKAQRQMADGVFFVLSYGYSREHEGYFFNDQDTYNNKYTLMEAKTSYNNNGTPRHNLRASGTYQLPFGRGRKFLGNTNRLVDAVVGGWSTSSMLQWASGPLINFNAAVVTGDPCQNVPAGDWFNPSVFKILPADTPRTNPWYYPCARGPHFWELDSTAVKYFNLTEQVKLEVRAEFYNMPNHFVPADPVVSVGSGSMGKSIDINPGMYGRQLQYVLRLHF